MMYEMTNSMLVKTLENLSQMLDKASHYAESKKFEMEVLMQSRLAPDQFPLVRQIQIACDTAKFGASRLTGKEVKAHEDNEKTLGDVKSRIASVVEILKSMKPADYAEAATRKVTTPRWNGEHMIGLDFAHHHVVPNFYFHVTTAYAILRHNGVEIGKKDYLGALPMKK